jgi:hypothetical protein
LPRIFETIFLLFTLDDLALERRFEDWRVKTGRSLVKSKWFLFMVDTSKQSNDILRIADTSHAMSQIFEKVSFPTQKWIIFLPVQRVVF